MVTFNYVLKSYLLGIIPLEQSHTGEYLNLVLIKLLTEFKIENSIFR